MCAAKIETKCVDCSRKLHYFEKVGEVSDSGTISVSMCNDDDLYKETCTQGVQSTQITT